MKKFSTSLFLIGASVFVLSSCSGSEGPGKIGTVDDIVVKNNGLPSAAATQSAPIEGQEFSSTVEQGQAMPAPDVAPAETLTDPATISQDQTNQPQDPVQAAIAPAADSQTVTPEENQAPLQEIAQAEPAPATAVVPDIAPTPAPSAPTAANVSVPVAAPVYPLDPNAPYSPKAVAAANAAAAPASAEGTTAVVTPAPAAISKINMNDPAIIRSTQAALAAKAMYTGPQTGIMDAALLNSITEYQAKNGLPQGGLNEPTLRSLGLIE